MAIAAKETSWNPLLVARSRGGASHGREEVRDGGIQAGRQSQLLVKFSFADIACTSGSSGGGGGKGRTLGS